MKGFEQIGIIFRSVFGSNPNTEIENSHTKKLTRSVEKAVSKYKESTEQERLSADRLAQAISSISRRLD